MATAPHPPCARLPSAFAGTKPVSARFAHPGKNRAAFTLVEIMIVVVIIGLLAALAVPTFQRVKIKSQAARMANDFRQYEAAFERYSLETGALPPATGMGIIPPGMTGYLPDSYTQTSPLGGQYLWSGPSQNVVLRGTYAIDEVMQLVDKTLDDGNLTTGDFTKISDQTFGYLVH